MAKFVVHLPVSARRFLNQGRRVASAQRVRIQAVKRAIQLLNGKKVFGTTWSSVAQGRHSTHAFHALSELHEKIVLSRHEGL